MVDGHVHLERGNYCFEWINEFIQYGLDRKIDEIYFLEHTHIFNECQSLYNEMSTFNSYQAQWYSKKRQNARPIEEYIQFIERAKKQDFPIKLKFGLEVCYSLEHEKDIEKIKRLYPFDFLVGSIHFIDGWAFSHLRQPWDKNDYDMPVLYSRYYKLMYDLVQSQLFSGLAHPNSLQCFGAYPGNNHGADYEKLAKALKNNNMYIEQSSGLAINYGDSELGMPKEMLRYMIQKDVRIITASDAHVPQKVGKLISEMNDIISDAKRNIN